MAGPNEKAYALNRARERKGFERVPISLARQFFMSIAPKRAWWRLTKAES